MLCFVLSLLDNWKCIWVNRELNAKAHDLSQVGMLSDYVGRQVFEGERPP